MSAKLLDRPTHRCDSGAEPAPSKEEAAEVSQPAALAPKRSGGLPMASSGVGAALSREAVDMPWQDLLRASGAARLPLIRLDIEQAEVLLQRGVPSAIIHRLVHGYPASPIRMGTLVFFPPVTQLFEARRCPTHFYVAQAFEGDHVFKRRLRQALADLEESDSDKLSDDELDVTLLATATRYIEAFETKPAIAQDASIAHWLPGAEAALSAGANESATPDGRKTALLGPAMSWEDYRSELERRLMVARLWFLLGLVGAIAALSRGGPLSSRLLVAFGVLGILGGGLGLAPWLRTSTRLRELFAADPTRRDAMDATP